MFILIKKWEYSIFIIESKHKVYYILKKMYIFVIKT